MAHLINSSPPLEVSRRLDSAATLLSDSMQPGAIESAALAAADSPLPADPNESARFREEIRRRCEAPLLLPRRHDGLNE
jgi:hypothetical protein